MTPNSTPRRKRGFTLVEVIVVLGIIIGLSSVIFGYVQSAQQSAATSQLIQDVDYVRSAALSYGQTQGGRYTGISANRLVALGLLAPRFNCGNGMMKNSDQADSATNATLAPCNENPFNASWLLAPVTGQPGQYDMTIVSERTDEAFYQALGLRYGTLYVAGIDNDQTGQSGMTNRDEVPTVANFTDIVRVEADGTAQTVTIRIEP